MNDTLNQINKGHRRIKTRNPGNQKYRDEIAITLRRQRADWAKAGAHEELSKVSRSYAYVTQKYGYTKEAALLLISYWEGKTVINFIDSFAWRMDKELFVALLNEKTWYRHDQHSYDDDHGTYLKNTIVSNYLKGIEDLDKSLAKKLIEKWLRSYVIANIKLFTWLDAEIANQIIDYQEGYNRLWANCVMRHLALFAWLDHSIIAKKLVEIWSWEALADNIENMQNINYEEIADMLINDKSHYYYQAYVWRMTRESSFSDRGLVDNIEKFIWVKKSEIKRKLKENWSKYM
jgi:hypothetical protein